MKVPKTAAQASTVALSLFTWESHEAPVFPAPSSMVSTPEENNSTWFEFLLRYMGPQP